MPGPVRRVAPARRSGAVLEAGLGTPICTPAHGTAFDIVGAGKASLNSMRNAYRVARRLTDKA
ncbi:4-hydroxythreonine-4-phosphate dehydrogenase PdxA [Streptomyces sp. NBC_00569]|uniref:4-hydroxythreonine-4-phosphate dehydrogenase PdxA n=2 Tax=Streptomyces TaxID=1883 RepID=UPI00224FEFC8|nr:MULTISPECIES: 4-hydroxythreonine-4-phosphate dehydrogenase PdxA [unclassified Streptomyces]MCX5443612.1 4-hydroxythreonine-4-phosphate dehydrogenase PdxA [Streptomyces sp. NBC_00063]WUB99001.1 4-hydroxythreonine-4-phosphate dehydrogenase PdxA [Streptomyces sp. NBC_00569]